jgi:ferredoxin
MGVVFWLHIKRLQRPVLLPPRTVLWTVVGALIAAAVMWPIAMAPQAQALTLPADVPADIFFAFWLPIALPLGGAQALLVATTAGAALLVVPRMTRPRATSLPPPSVVVEDLCVGCVQCAVDCPYGAIRMIDREDGREGQVARVDPRLCVSCGICAGSCAPMGVGPAGRSGRDQVEEVRAFLSSGAASNAIVVIGCQHGGLLDDMSAAGAVPYAVDCAGNLHTSVVEILLRGGAAGVLVVACPPRDCWHREGPRWLYERVYEGREAELQPRVDRARVRVLTAGASDRRTAIAGLHAFAADVRNLRAPALSPSLDVSTECEPAILESET